MMMRGVGTRSRISTEIGLGFFAVEMSEVATSTRPTKREIPLTTPEVRRAPDARGACASRVGMQRANEASGEIVSSDTDA
jgi:hypothetical protein